ncbi:MAG: hypothetical protein K2K97_02370, partial [Muribaculaceae bacterium]|nr:hypothetical protein [Muribaculaceae bacterium]
YTALYITPAFLDFVGGLSSGMITLEYVISDLASASEEQLLSYYEKHPTCFGTLKDGVFTAPAKPTDLFYQNGDPVEWLMGAHFSDQQAGYIYFVNTKAQFTMTLPGVEIPEAPDPFDSYTFVGDCKMQQNFLDNLFSETGTPEGTVQVYEEPEYPGVFHIKNAYVAGDWNNAETAANIDLSIDLYDPSYGMIDEQSTGYFDDQYGSIVEIMSASMVYTAYIADQMTKQQFLMTYPNMNLYLDRATKRIVMPALSVWYYFPELAPGQEYYNQMIYNDGNASWIQLPESYIVGGAGVNEILTDQVDAPARYYNLQGVEVANPAKGELVIVKKGSKSSKVIF